MAGPVWDAPGPLGYPDAIASMGTVAAPLLAGFALTLLGIVLTSPERLRWADWVALPLVVGTVALLASVQFTFWARQYAASPAALTEWHPEATAADREMNREEQWSYRATHDRWAVRASRAYQIGIVMLLGAMVLILVPKGTPSDLRLATISVALLASLLEVVWIAIEVLPSRLVPERLKGWRGRVIAVAPPKASGE